MWRAVARNAWVLCLIGLLAAPGAGCSDGECLDCLEGEPCPSFLGTYDCVSQGSMDTCSGFDLTGGTTTLWVEVQDNNELSIALTDSNGLSGEFSGQICNTSDPGSGAYHFNASFQVPPSVDFQVYYHLSGQFILEDPALPPRLDAALTLQLFIPDSGQPACTLSDHLSGERLE